MTAGDNKYLGGLKIAKEGSVFFYEEVSLYFVGGNYYIVNHDSNGLPSFKNIQEGKVSPLWSIKPVDEVFAEVFADAMHFIRMNSGKNLSTYSTLFTYMKMNGYDLIDLGILSSEDEFKD